MGMFDSVIYKCPDCDEEIEEQSKAGVCELEKYTQSYVPLSVAGDIDGVMIECDCGSKFKQVINGPSHVYVMLVREK